MPSPTEIIMSGGIAIIAMKEAFNFVKSFAPKTRELTSLDMQQMKYQTEMASLMIDVKNILIKLSDRQEETKALVKEIEHIQNNTHRRIGQIEAATDVLKMVITKDIIETSVKNGIKESKDLLRSILKTA
jgi:hypothetical protein